MKALGSDKSARQPRVPSRPSFGTRTRRRPRAPPPRRVRRDVHRRRLGRKPARLVPSPASSRPRPPPRRRQLARGRRRIRAREATSTSSPRDPSPRTAVRAQEPPQGQPRVVAVERYDARAVRNAVSARPLESVQLARSRRDPKGPPLHANQVDVRECAVAVDVVRVAVAAARVHRADSSAICPGELDGSLELGCVRSRGATGKIAPLLASRTVFNALKPVRALPPRTTRSRAARPSAPAARPSTSTSSTSPPPPFASFREPRRAGGLGFGFRFGFGFFGLSADGSVGAAGVVVGTADTVRAVRHRRPPAGVLPRGARRACTRRPPPGSSACPRRLRRGHRRHLRRCRDPDARAASPRPPERLAHRREPTADEGSASMRSALPASFRPRRTPTRRRQRWRATPRGEARATFAAGTMSGTVPLRRRRRRPPPGVSSNITARSSSSPGPATCAGIVAGGAVLHAFRPQPPS